MINTNYSKYIFFIILYLSVSFNSLSGAQIRPGVKTLERESVPDYVIFFDEKGEKVSLDKFEGKTILLVFWATWCASCSHQIPELDILQKDFRKLPFEIVPISQDYQGIEAVKKYYTKYEIRYLPIYHDYKNQLFKALGIIGMPTAILVDTDGKMLLSFVGSISWHDEEIRSLLLSYIPGNYPDPKNSYQAHSLNQIYGNKPKEQEKKNEEEKIDSSSDSKEDGLKEEVKSDSKNKQESENMRSK